ncbi:MAG: 16S rRNA (cytosine(1402)-N(4))-methyltransferase RsmH [Planctomycetota bacterium]
MNEPTASDSIHVPVLPAEVLEAAAPKEGEVWVDGTAGAGGHTSLISRIVGESGRVISIDRDPEAASRLQRFAAENVIVVQGSYHQLGHFLAQLDIPAVDGVLLDLGLSSDQLENRSRGFSFKDDGELDMRFDPTEGEPVWVWLQYAKEKEIADSIYQYGEERFSRRIAKRIVEFRRKEKLRTVAQLRELIYASVPGGRRTGSGRRAHGRIDPATRTFQALRIVANQELDILEKALRDVPEFLATGGRFAVISFHSLEDRLVKHAFREDLRLEVQTKKPIQATEPEIERNPRSRSAKLRVASRC